MSTSLSKPFDGPIVRTLRLFLLAGRNPFWFIDNKIGNDMNIIELRPRLLVALSQYDKIIILCDQSPAAKVLHLSSIFLKPCLPL